MLDAGRDRETESRVRLEAELKSAAKIRVTAQRAVEGEATGAAQAKEELPNEFRRCLGRHSLHLLGVPAVSVAKVEGSAYKEPVSP